MATVLSPRNAARYGRDVAYESTDGIFAHDGHTHRAIVERDDVSSAARKRARRAVKRAERAEFRAELSAILSGEEV